jgi:hypothetical protein
MAQQSSKEIATKIVAHLEERRTGFARTFGSMKRKESNEVVADLAALIDGKSVAWKPKTKGGTLADDEVEIEDAE